MQPLLKYLTSFFTKKKIKKLSAFMKVITKKIYVLKKNGV